MLEEWELGSFDNFHLLHLTWVGFFKRKNRCCVCVCVSLSLLLKYWSLNKKTFNGGLSCRRYSLGFNLCFANYILYLNSSTATRLHQKFPLEIVGREVLYLLNCAKTEMWFFFKGYAFYIHDSRQIIALWFSFTHKKIAFERFLIWTLWLSFFLWLPCENIIPSPPSLQIY